MSFNALSHHERTQYQSLFSGARKYDRADKKRANGREERGRTELVEAVGGVQKVSNAGEFSGKLWERVERTPVETLENTRVCYSRELMETTRIVLNRTHNRSVAGSIPARPTNLDFFFAPMR